MSVDLSPPLLNSKYIDSSQDSFAHQLYHQVTFASHAVQSKAHLLRNKSDSLNATYFHVNMQRIAALSFHIHMSITDLPLLYSLY